MGGFGRDGKTEDEIVFMRQCARENPLRFYNSALWEKTRDAVLEMDHHECQDCKAKGVYTQAECVHHNYFFKLYPHWGVSVWVDAGGEKKRNLVSLCIARHTHTDSPGSSKIISLQDSLRAISSLSSCLGNDSIIHTSNLPL